MAVILGGDGGCSYAHSAGPSPAPWDRPARVQPSEYAPDRLRHIVARRRRMRGSPCARSAGGACFSS